MTSQNSIGVLEAKTHFSQLIERTMHGEKIFITRRGQPVVKLLPANIHNGSQATRDAVVRLRALAQEMQLG